MDEEKKESGTITIKKRDLWKYSTFILLAIVIIGGFVVLKGEGSSGGAATGAVTDTGTNNQPSINAKALIEANDPVLGSTDAKISIIEFSDFQCPFCARAHTGALADFRNSDYFKNGKVNLVYKQFPLSSIHPYAQKAAEASLCANEQGKFWEYHDTLFTNQGSLDTASLKTYATQLGLNSAQFNSCLDDNKYRTEVSKELSQATSAGGQGTPFFVIVNTETGDATSVSGAVPWANFEAAINAVL